MDTNLFDNCGKPIPDPPTHLSGAAEVPIAYYDHEDGKWKRNKIIRSDGVGSNLKAQPKWKSFASIDYSKESLFFKMALDSTITANDIRVWMVYAHHMQIGNYVHITQKQVASIMETSKSAISIATSRLIDSGYLAKVGLGYFIPRGVVFRGKWNSFEDIVTTEKKDG